MADSMKSTSKQDPMTKNSFVWTLITIGCVAVATYHASLLVTAWLVDPVDAHAIDERHQELANSTAYLIGSLLAFILGIVMMLIDAREHTTKKLVRAIEEQGKTRPAQLTPDASPAPT